MALPVPSEIDGRRIYIHEYSLELLAGCCVGHANTIRSALILTWTKRIVCHYIENAALIGLLPEELAEKFCATLTLLWSQSITELFRFVVQQHPRKGMLDLLEPGEEFVATCYEAGYYTFATSSSAAARMFDDSEPLKALYSKVATGVGPQDLRMVRGARLRLKSACTSIESDDVSSQADIDNVVASHVGDVARRAGLEDEGDEHLAVTLRDGQAATIRAIQRHVRW